MEIKEAIRQILGCMPEKIYWHDAKIKGKEKIPFARFKELRRVDYENELFKKKTDITIQIEIFGKYPHSCTADDYKSYVSDEIKAFYDAFYDIDTLLSDFGFKRPEGRSNGITIETRPHPTGEWCLFVSRMTATYTGCRKSCDTCSSDAIREKLIELEILPAKKKKFILR